MSASPNFMTSKFIVDVTDPSTYHDRVLIVGDTKFYVVSGILITWSEFFRGIFTGNFAESSGQEIELKDVEPAVFKAFLLVLYEKNLDFAEWNSDLLIPLMDCAFRFLSPTVLGKCREYVEKNFESLDSLKLELLKKSCDYGIEDLKEKIINSLQEDSVICKFDFDEMATLAIGYKLDDLKDYLVTYRSASVTVENICEFLDFSEKYNMTQLKKGISTEVDGWNRHMIPQEGVIEILKCAFRHQFEPLKLLIRQAIYYNTKETADVYKTHTPICSSRGSTCNPYSGGYGYNKCQAEPYQVKITVNSFLEMYHEQIYKLPTEIREFILNSTFRFN